MSNTKHTSAREILEEIVPCQDCGGYVSDHQGVQGDCNYEAGTEIVDQAIAQLLALLEGELIGEDKEYEGVTMNWAVEHQNVLRAEQRDRLKKLMGNTGGDNE